jgi:hypothetical protein
MTLNYKDIFPEKFIRYYLIAGIFEILLAFIFLLLIPADPKNSWFMGYSLSRITLALVLLALGIFHGWAFIWQQRKGRIYAFIPPRLIGPSLDYGFSIPIILIACSLVFFGTYLYLYIATPNLTTLQGYLVRFSPFMLLAATRIIQTIIILTLMGIRIGKQKGQQNKKSPNTIVISPRKIGLILGFVAFFLVIASIGVEIITRFTWDSRVLGLGPRFNLNREHNIPSYFSAILLLICGALFSVISIIRGNRNNHFKVYWSFLAFIFLFLSVDESTSIHEMFSDPLREFLGTGGIFYYAWILVAIPLIILFIVGYWRFFQHLPRVTKTNIGFAFIIFISGAIGFEMLGGWYESQFGDRHLMYDVIVTIEESLEMTGSILLIRALLDFIASDVSIIRFEIRGRNGSSKHISQ